MKRLLLFLLICLSLGLASCCNPNSPNATCHPPGWVPPPPDCGAILRAQGVQIIRTGETYTVVVPSDKIFYPDSANFNPVSAQVLHPLTCYLQQFETTFMKITGFTDNRGSMIRNKALSERQAQKLGEYFSEKGMDARIIYELGLGAARPVGDNTIPSHQVWNRRIEIKFRQVVLAPLI